MDFSQRKLTKAALSKLYRIKVDSVKPFALMSAPVYLWLNVNEKFIALKAPLDFFTENELKRLKAYDYFYLPEQSGGILPFSNAAHRVRALLNAKAHGKSRSGVTQQNYPEVALPPAPYELSNEIIKIVGSLWWEHPGKNSAIEPYLVTIFVNELCDAIPSETLFRAREQNVKAYDRGLIRSSWVVFLALHLGYCDLQFLNRLRTLVFEENSQDEDPLEARKKGIVIPGASISDLHGVDLDSLILTAYETVTAHTQLVTNLVFAERTDRASQKISDRLKRVRRELMSHGPNRPTVFGEEGFIET